MFISAPEHSDGVARVYESSASTQGFVMNLTRAWAWRPDIYEAFGALRTQLASASTFSKREQAVVVCATAAQLGDAYCSLAWGKTLAGEAGEAAVAAVIGASEASALSVREQALAAWARKVVADPNGTTARDVDALRGAGLSDREVFELTAFIAFRLAFSTVNDALGIHPDWQLAETVPGQVRDAVDFGRAAAPRPNP